jgi:hypothetical protein
LTDSSQAAFGLRIFCVLGHHSLKEYLPILISVLVVASASAASGENRRGIHTTGGVFRTTFESVSLPGDEDMGFGGFTFLYDAVGGVSVGPGLYGAMTGERGGFITLGLSGELKKELSDRFSLSAGLFVGAGGGHGGHYLSGGGLMLRPHAGVTFRLGKNANLGIGCSHVEFPDGIISSTQPYFAAELPFEMLIETGWSDSHLLAGDPTTRLPSSEREVSILYTSYRVPSSVRTVSGEDAHETIGLLGARWDVYIDRNAFLAILTQGAMQGRSDGYMQILFGGGYRFTPGRGTRLKLSFGAGAGGGGGVDTGGGLLVGGELAVQQDITDSIYLAVSGGYAYAPDGSFEALSTGLQVGARYDTPTVSGGTYDPTGLSGYDRNLFRFRFAHQTYLNDNNYSRLHHTGESTDCLGFAIDYFPTKNLYLTGQGLAAYGGGNAGAYMKGLLGAGLQYSLGNSPVFIDLSALAGAAGGGGVSVGSGFVWQVNAGLGIHLTDAFSLLATVGHIDAPGGNFKATVAGASVGFRFGMFANQ